MRRIVEQPLSAAVRSRVLTILIAAVFLVPLAANFGCVNVKRKVRVDVPKPILNARNASFDDLLRILRSYDKIKTLSSGSGGMELTFTSTRNWQSGELERYRNLHGHILLKRPDSIRLFLLVPLANTRLFDLVSVGDSLTFWTRENKIYEGRNSASPLVFEDPSRKDFSVPIRGTHIFEAIFPQSVAPDSPDLWIGMEEQKDSQFSYYELTFAKLGQAHRIHIVRKIWIERSGLSIARQQVFEEEGRLVSDITYQDQTPEQGLLLPLRIHIERPLDGYTLDLKFRGWSINPDLEKDAFELVTPPGAQVIRPKKN